MSDTDILKLFSKAQDSLVIQQSDFSLSAIYQMVENQAIDIAPHYQRRERWSKERQSALIESFLLNVPVPPVYLSEDDYGTYSVIDGKQRVSAIRDFLSGKLKLFSLKRLLVLEGYTFQELPLQLQNALTVRPYIRVITLLKQSDKDLKYEVFLRLNTGGEKLKPQEIRNVAYSGPLNDLLFELANNEFLKQKLKIHNNQSTAYKNMDDLEHVLRFLTIREGWDSSKMGSVLSDEMDLFMQRHRRDAPETFRAAFTRAITICEGIWSEYAFQKPVVSGYRDQFISPLYDAQMVATSMLSDREVRTLMDRRDHVLTATRALFDEDFEFFKSVSQSTNNRASIHTRIEKMFLMLQVIAGRDNER